MSLEMHRETYRPLGGGCTSVVINVVGKLCSPGPDSLETVGNGH